VNAYDIETFNDSDGFFIPYCICFNIGKTFFNLYYDSEKNIIEDSIILIFKNIKKKKYFYIHNIQFDGFIILNYLSNLDKYKIDLLIKNGSIYYLSIKENNKNIIFKCSYKIIPTSLKKISQSFNLSIKLPFPYKFTNLNTLNYVGYINKEYFNNYDDFQNFNKNNSILDFREYSIKYCTNDVRITKLFIEKINEIVKSFSINIDKIYSAPSLSLKIFDKRFNKSKIKLNTGDSFDSYIRPSYYGGRCEIYGNPKQSEHIFHFDFSGMYGQCMKEKFCYGEHRIVNNPKDFNIPGFYWVKWKSVNNYLPLLPHHSKKNNKLMFTNGIMEGCYWFEELVEFLKNGEILDIKSGIVFEKYDYVFNDFVEFFTDIRQKSEAHKIFGKLMINSLYGRMGMSSIDNYSIIIKEEDLEKYEDLTIISLKKINKLYLLTLELDNRTKNRFKEFKSKFKKNVSIASSITSKSRLKLYKAQNDVLINKGRLLYSDTDSIFAAYKKDVSNEKHGEIFWDSLKKDTKIKDAVFISPKSYSILYSNGDEITKIKGYDQNKIKFSDLKENFYIVSDPINIEDNIILNKRNLIIKKTNRAKIFNFNNYDKRFFVEDKKNTKALYTEDGVNYLVK
jgi:hypothetical protein